MRCLLYYPSLFFFSSSRWGLWRLLFHHAGILEHVCPFPAGARMAVLEMLPEMVRPVKLLGAVALAELVMVLEVANALVPVLVRHMPPVARGAHGSRPREFLTAVAARVRLARPRGGLVKGSVVARERRAGPRVAPHVQ